MEKATNTGAFYGALLGMIGGVVAWNTSAYLINGHINVEALGGLYPMLIGNSTVFIISGVISIGHGLLAEKEFDFDELKDKFKSFDEHGDEPLREEVAYGSTTTVK